MRERFVKILIACLFAASFNGASANSPEQDLNVAEKALAASIMMVGRPYKYSGNSPAGFDCSGLVLYSYKQAGRDLPHGTASLKQISRPVPLNEVRKGDLVFFDINGRAYSHVGIYAGDNRFIHAASKRKAVRIDNLLDPYWKERLREARRLNGTEGTLEQKSSM